MPTRGTYQNSYPVGAVVHFTAGRSLKGDSDALNTIRNGIANGYCYFCISSDGTIFQSFPLNKWGYHCGKSEWPGLGSSLSNKLVGIEICNAGKLDANGKSWFGETYPESQTRVVGSEYGEAGKYHKYTDAQEKSLIELLIWLKLNNPDVFKVENILGHHEISPRRKNDPCGSLSMTMPKLRELIEKSL
jgi:N-acetyl-anhydromuramyl-L-alanine amidase AmpD